MRVPGRVRISRLAALVAWLGLLFGYQWHAWWQGVGPLETVRHLIDVMSSGLAGPLIYILFYALRPLILMPASLLTLAAGFVFGPVFGVVFTVLGSNISASVAYLASRYFGGSFQGSERKGDTLHGYAERLRRNSFESVLTMRLIFVPFDAVNYAAGLLRALQAFRSGDGPRVSTRHHLLCAVRRLDARQFHRRNAGSQPLDPPGFGADRRRKPPSVASPQTA